MRRAWMFGPRIAITLPFALLLFGPLLAKPETSRRIEITASKFSYSPNQITLKKGEAVVLVLHSTDVTHGLKIPDLHVVTEIKKGKDSEIPLTPTQTGHFNGKCAHFCGSGHGSMALEIEVVELIGPDGPGVPIHWPRVCQWVVTGVAGLHTSPRAR